MLNLNRIIKKCFLFQFILIWIPNIIESYDYCIKLRVNGTGFQQIISDYFDVENYAPFKIHINNGEVQILKDRKVLVEKSNYDIKLEWDHPNDNLTYMFANISSIVSATVSNMFNGSCNVSYMFYNCINLDNITIESKFSHSLKDASYSFYNCTSLKLFNFKNLTIDYINMSYMFYNCINLFSIIYSPINSNIKINDMKYSFYGCSSLTSINLNKFESQNDINISYTFYNCHSLMNVDINNDNFKINDMRYIFYNNTALQSVKGIFNSDIGYNASYSFYNCTNLTNYDFNNILIKPNDMRSMFYNCSELISTIFKLGIDISKINMTKMFFNCHNLVRVDFNIDDHYFYIPNDMHAMFYNCTNLTSLQLNYFSTNEVLDMSYMLYNCINLENFEYNNKLNNYLTKSMRGMFENCVKFTSLTLPNFDTSNVEIMWSMFKGCTGLNFVDLSNFDTSKVTDMESMFEGCTNLESLSLSFNTSKVKYMNKMFKDCFNLKNLSFPNISCDSIGTMQQMFYNCQSLEYLNIFSLKERGQSTIDIFTNASNHFKICIEEHENIPEIFNIIKNVDGISRDCSNNCYEYERVNISEKKYCCPKYKYGDNCYEKCPPKTRTNDNDPNDKICKDFNCSNKFSYSYEQDTCLDQLPNGYFINDTEYKTIDKCHSDCFNCKGKGVKGNTNCTQCNNDLHIYKGNCYDSCLRGNYTEGGKIYCKCFDEKCFKCNEESLAYDLCITCNEKEKYYEKLNENYINDFVNCYKEPEKFFYDSNWNKFSPCFESCKYCTKLGTYESHLCTSCNSNFSFAIQNGYDGNDTIYNCYPNCSYYYFFDENKTYQCTIDPICPPEYRRLINGTRECVKNCSDLKAINKTKEYRKTCYKSCPVPDYLLIKDGNLCRSKCPKFEEPFEMKYDQICVSNCTIMQRKDELCITNYYGNRSNLEIQDKVFYNLIDDMVETFDFKYLNDNISIILEEDNCTHIYEIMTTNCKVSNQKTSTLYLKNCENKLKAYYSIPDEDPLYVLKLDAYREGQTGPTVEYQIFYPLNKRKLEQLDLTICEGDGVSLLVSANITEDEIDMYNKNSGFYNDICYTYTSGSGTDLTLEDRQGDFSNNNKSLCEADCEFVKYHSDLGKAECSCDVKTTAPLISDIKVDKDKLYQFIDLKKLMNFDVMKCYNLLTSISGIKENIGFYVFFPAFVAYFISIIIFYKKDFNLIKYQIKEIVYAKRYLNYFDYVPKAKPINLEPKNKEPIFMTYLKKKNIKLSKNFGNRKTNPIFSKSEIIQNKIEININIEKKSKSKNQIKNNKLKEIKELTEQENEEQNNNDDIIIKKNKINKKKNIFNDDICNEKDNKNSNQNAPPIKSNNNNIKPSKKSKTFNFMETNGENIENDIDLGSDDDKSKPARKLTEKEKQRIKDILKHNENELNDLSYKEALKYDRRTFLQFYFSLLKSKHIFITLLEKRDYNSRIIKLFLCFYSFAFGYAVNALFFSDDTMHKIHEDGGEFNFWYQLPQIIYSTIISYILENFLNYLAFSEEDVINLKKEKVVKHIGRKAKEVLRTLSLKFMLFYIMSLLLLIVFWYYISCFCAVYRNTQYHLIKDTLISFGTSLLYPFGMYLIVPMFRIPSLKGYSKSKQAIYKFSQFLLFF